MPHWGLQQANTLLYYCCESHRDVGDIYFWSRLIVNSYFFHYVSMYIRSMNWVKWPSLKISVINYKRDIAIVIDVISHVNDLKDAEVKR
jgi:hypothetical protein